MILKASQRGGAGRLAAHLMNGHDNEHVEVHEIDGFMGQTVHEALHEIEAMSKGTRCQQYMFSLSLSPPANVRASTQLFEQTINRIVDTMGLQNQPHIVVFHEKESRRHCHCVWSRIDADGMRAINLPYFKNKLMEVGKAIYLEQGWDLPQGHIDRAKSNPLNYDLQDWQQAKRQRRDPKEIKAILQRCWQDTANKTAFEKAIEEHGFYLACGHPRRGFVVVDWSGKVRSLSRQTGVKAKDLAVKLGKAEDLSSTETVQKNISKKLVARLQSLTDKLHQNHLARLAPFEHRKAQLAQDHAKARQDLINQQKTLQRKEAQERQQRLSKGIRRVWHMLTGQHKRTLRQNAHEEHTAKLRDQSEIDKLRFGQLAERQNLQTHIDDLNQKTETERQTLITQIITQLDKHQKSYMEQTLSQHLSI